MIERTPPPEAGDGLPARLDTGGMQSGLLTEGDFRALLEVSPDSMLVVDSDGVIGDLNPRLPHSPPSLTMPEWCTASRSMPTSTSNAGRRIGSCDRVGLCRIVRLAVAKAVTHARVGEGRRETQIDGRGADAAGGSLAVQTSSRTETTVQAAVAMVGPDGEPW